MDDPLTWFLVAVGIIAAAWFLDGGLKACCADCASKSQAAAAPTPSCAGGAAGYV